MQCLTNKSAISPLYQWLREWLQNGPFCLGGYNVNSRIFYFLGRAKGWYGPARAENSSMALGFNNQAHKTKHAQAPSPRT